MIVIQVAIVVACLASIIWFFIEFLRYLGRADEKSELARRQLGRVEWSVSTLLLLGLLMLMLLR